MKSRLVAGRHLQERLLESATSAPTASLPAIFVIAATAAQEHRHVLLHLSLDIPGAYRNVPIVTTVYTNIDRPVIGRYPLLT